MKFSVKNVKSLYEEIGGIIPYFVDNLKFPEEEMELFDALDFIQKNQFSEESLTKFSRIFWDWIVYRGATAHEREKYDEVFEIEDSSKIYMGYNIKNSSKISRSFFVKDSSEVDGSENISKSQNIRYSQDIENGSFISDSWDVLNSTNIIEGRNIVDSDSIYGSKDISSSSVVSYSDSIRKSYGVFSSQNCEEVYFSSSLKDCSYCLFCSGLEGKRFYIFNQPCSERDFFIVKELILQKYFKSYIPFDYFKNESFEWCGFKSNYDGSDFTIRRDFFGNIKKEFFSYLKTAPNYNSWLVYNITLRADVVE